MPNTEQWDWTFHYDPDRPSPWPSDNPNERRELQERYYIRAHAEYIREHPDFVPCCECHQDVRRERLAARETK